MFTRNVCVVIVRAMLFFFVLFFLLDGNVQVDTVDLAGQTALMYACSNKRPQIVHYLIEAGAHVDHQDLEGRTPLMWAASMGCMPSVRALVKHNCDIMMRDTKPREGSKGKQQWTAADWATECQQNTAGKFLKEKMKKIRQANNAEKRRASLQAKKRSSSSLEMPRSTDHSPVARRQPARGLSTDSIATMPAPEPEQVRRQVKHNYHKKIIRNYKKQSGVIIFFCNILCLFYSLPNRNKV